MSRIDDRIYWIASHDSNGKGQPQPARRRFFATTAVENTPVLTARPLVTQSYAHLLEKALADPRPAPSFQHASKLDLESEAGLSIEGLAAAPNGELMSSLRNQGRYLSAGQVQARWT